MKTITRGISATMLCGIKTNHILSLCSFSILLIIFLVSGITNSLAQDKWTPKQNFKGGNRSEAIGFAIGDKAYVGLGYNSVKERNDSSLKKDFWEYDPVANVWTQRANFEGEARYSAVGLAINGKGYVGLGTTRGFTSVTRYFNDFWMYDPIKNLWMAKREFPESGRSYAAGFAISNKGYIGTGSAFIPNEVFYPDFYEYDTESDTWLKKEDFMGGNRTAASTFAIDGEGYLGLGYSNSSPNWRKDFYKYNPGNNTWTKLNDFPGLEREWAASFAIGSLGFVGTGFNNYQQLKDFWEYNSSDDSWTEKKEYGGGLTGGAIGFSIESKGYIGLGGNATFDCKDDFWEYEPKITNAIDFDGVNDYIHVPGSFGGPNWKELTVEAWVSVDGMTPDIQAIFSSASTEEWVHFQMLEDNQGNNVAYTDRGIVFLPNIPKTVGVWKHVAMVIKSGDSRLYIDGVQVGAATTRFNYIKSTNTVDIGRGYGYGRLMNGKIDELRIWNVARTEEEIQANMNLKICGNTNGLFAYYPFDQGIAGGNNMDITVDDVSMNNNDATLNNFSLAGSNSNWVSGNGNITSVDEDCGSVCVVPTHLTASDITSTKAQLSWESVNTAFKYEIHYKAAGATAWSKPVYTAATSKYISGLTPTTLYYWEVKSICSKDNRDNSEWSAQQSFTTAAFRIGEGQTATLQLYPNPVAETFTLDLQLNSTTSSSASIYLLNSLGQNIYSSNEITGNGALRKVITMPQSATAGWYIVRVVMDDQVIEQKLLYQK